MTLMLEVLDEQDCIAPEEACFGALRTERGHLPLKAMGVDARIIGLHYRASVTQTFVNAFSEPLEAVYVFPLPHRAGVTSFRMRVADRVVEGVLKEKNEARREYAQALQDGYRAALAQEESPNVFTMSAGNLAPGEALAVELEMSGPLEFSEGEATFRFPLVVAPRYAPATALPEDSPATPGAGAPLLLPGMPNKVYLGLRVEIDPAGLPLTAVRSSLHQVRLENYGDLRVVSLRPGVERLDRDFILRFPLSSTRVVSGISRFKKPDEKESTVALTLVPPDLAHCGVRHRDVVIVLDRSGSMEGWKMAAARRAAGRIIDSLTSHDRFAVLVFDTVTDSVPGLPDLAEATDRARCRAVRFLSTVTARGGTEMEPAFEHALARLSAEPGRDRAVVVITDGQVNNERALLRRVQQAHGVRFHAVGIDRAVNAAFLEQLGSLTGGSSELVESESRLDEVMRRVHHRVGRPVLRDVRIELPGIRELSPAGPLDLYPGTPVIVTGRFEREVPGNVEIVGALPGGAEYRTRLAVHECADPVFETIWARGRVLDLEHRYSIDGGAALSQEIVAFSLRWGVLSRFTAFVAVDRSEVVPGGRVSTRLQPLETPSGWSGGAGSPACSAPSGGDFFAAAPEPFRMPDDFFGATAQACPMPADFFEGAARTTDCFVPAEGGEATDLFGVTPAPPAAPGPALARCPSPMPRQRKAERSAPKAIRRVSDSEEPLPSLDTLLALSPERLRQVLEHVDFEDLVAALVHCDHEIVERVCLALDEPTARKLRQRHALEWCDGARIRSARMKVLSRLSF